MFNMRKQRGLSGMATIFLLIVTITVVVLFLKLFPFYMENWKVAGVLNKMQEKSAEIIVKEPAEVERYLVDRLSEKEVRFITLETLKSYVSMIRDDRGYTIKIKYDRKAPLMGRVSFLVEFENVAILR
jgi:hypothetical protein